MAMQHSISKKNKVAVASNLLFPTLLLIICCSLFACTSESMPSNQASNSKNKPQDHTQQETEQGNHQKQATSRVKKTSKVLLAQIKNSAYYTDGSSVYFGFNTNNNGAFLLPGFDGFHTPEKAGNDDTLHYQPFNVKLFTLEAFLEKFTHFYEHHQFLSLSYGTYIAVKLPNVSLDNFKVISYRYGASNGSVFYKMHEIQNATDKNFQVIKGEFSRDNQHVFYKSSSINGADPATFVAMEKNYAKDKLRVFYKASVLDGADPDTFKMLENDFSKDKAHVYYHSHLMEEADPHSFEVVGYTYQKDNQHVWSHGELTSIDAKTFKIVTYVDPTFKSIKTTLYAVDKHHVYFQGKLMPEADPVTFSIMCSKDHCGVYAVDKKHVFYSGKVLEGADVETFRILDDGYEAYDKNHTYNRDQRIKQL